MVVEQLRRALAVAPRGRLDELAATMWRAFAAGALTEGEAQSLAEEIAARKAVPKPAQVAPVSRRRVGSRPRSPEAMERRRRWTASGWLPPQLAARFTMAETAALAVIAAEVARRGLCRLTLGHIAALAGVGRTTVQNAIRQAAALGILTSEEWRITAWRSAPNTVRITSAEWSTWLRMRDRKRAEGRRGHAEGARGRMLRPLLPKGNDEAARCGHMPTVVCVTAARADPGRPPSRGGGFRLPNALRSTDSFPTAN